MSEIETMRIYFAVILIAVGVGCLVALILARRPDSGASRLRAFAERSELPVPASEESALKRRMRREKIVELSSLIVACALNGVALASPLGLSPLYPITIFLPVLLVVSLLGRTALALREQLFAPPDDEPRIARSRDVRPADYLAPPQRVITWVLAGLALALSTWAIVASTRSMTPQPEVVIAVAVVASVVVGASIAVPFLESAILSRSQRASTPLELAWDDAFRTAAMNAARLSASMLSFIALILATIALFLSSSYAASWPLTLVVIAQVILSRVYPTTGAPLPRRLFPQGIHVAAGSTA